MSLLRTAILLGLTALVAAAALRFWLDRVEEAALSADLEAVRVLAVDYARHFCGAAVPGSPESLVQAATRIGRDTPGVTDPARWSIRLEARPGGAGPGVLVRYSASADDLANSIFNVLPGASAASGQIEIPVRRRQAGNSSGFRWLMSDAGC